MDPVNPGLCVTLDEVLDEASRLGTKIRPWPKWLRRFKFTNTLSQSWPWAIYLRNGVWEDVAQNTLEGLPNTHTFYLPLLNHELEHRRRQGVWKRSLLHILWWFFCYIFWPPSRHREEVRGFAYMAASSAWFHLPYPRDKKAVYVTRNGLTPLGVKSIRRHVFHKLGGWKYPYFTGGNSKEISGEIELLAAKILTEEVKARESW